MGEKTNLLKRLPQASPSLPSPPLCSLPLLLPPLCLPDPSRPSPHHPSPNLGLGPEEGVADIADFLVEPLLLVHTLDVAVRVVLGRWGHHGHQLGGARDPGVGGHPCPQPPNCPG